MNKAAKSVLVIAVVVLCAAAALGQTRMKAEVPFNFSVENRHLTSGEYTVWTMGKEILNLRDATGAPVRLFITIPMSDNYKGEPKLIFHRYGDEYVLSQIWMGEVGHELRPTKREAQLAKNGRYETVAMLLTPAK